MNKQDVNSKLLFKKANIKIIKADIIEDKEEYFVIKDIKTSEGKITVFNPHGKIYWEKEN